MSRVGSAGENPGNVLLTRALPKRLSRLRRAALNFVGLARRIQSSLKIDQTIVATSVGPADSAIAEFCNAHDIACYRGSENDVLDRYYQAAR